MSLIKSFAVGNGDMYYIRHGSDNFTVIDCSLPTDRAGSILAEIETASSDKGIRRFISTHPDQDHLSGLTTLDEVMPILNFYVVKNNAIKETVTADFTRYCELRDSSKAFYIQRGCQRRWMNQSDDKRKTSGINVIWPKLDDLDFKAALEEASEGGSPNNLSCIIRYKLADGPSCVWMGDLETEFMETVQDRISLEKSDILFAPHHGRDSGKVPPKWLSELDPSLIVIGEAPSEHLNYYAGFNIITQNSCGDVLFDCGEGRADIYVGDHAYETGDRFLTDEGLDHSHGLYYLGTLPC
jgi:hypothetical protein